MSAVRDTKLIDRRVIFLGFALAVLIPLLMPFKVPTKVSQPVRDYYKQIDRLPAGSKVLLSCDYDPSVKAELYPMNVATLRHLFERNIGVVVISLWEGGPPMAERALKRVAEEYGKVDGVDYVNLGFKEGRQVTMVAMGDSLREIFPKDYHGRSIEDIPLMRGVENYTSFDLLISLTAGIPGVYEYVIYVKSRFDIPLICAAAAIAVPSTMPFYQSQDISGFLTGIIGGAEYEELIESPGWATRAMGLLTIGQLMVIVFIILGNVSMWLTRRSEGTP